MHPSITESLEYEKGYLKGFHDGRKWTHENTHEPTHMMDMIERWQKFCDNHIEDSDTIEQQWKTMQQAWETYNGLPFDESQWRHLVCSKLMDFAEECLHKQTTMEQSATNLESLLSWMNNVKIK